MATLNVRTLGDYIRDQREHSQVSLRQLARQAGVSNPYLSQIERGLRKPSAEILQQIAKALRISAEALYVQAGILDARDAEGTVPAAVLSDATINERQKQVLLEIYDSFRKENDAKAPAASVADVVQDAGTAVASAVSDASDAVAAPAKAAVAKPAKAVKAAVAKAAPKKSTPRKKPAKQAPPAPEAAPATPDVAAAAVDPEPPVVPVNPT